MGLKDFAVEKILNSLRSTLLSDVLEGVGKINKIGYKDKSLTLSIELDGLEDKEIVAVCHNISISDDGASITLNDFESNMRFASTLLNRYLAGQKLPIPDGPARVAAKSIKPLLGL